MSQRVAVVLRDVGRQDADRARGSSPAPAGASPGHCSRTWACPSSGRRPRRSRPRSFAACRTASSRWKMSAVVSVHGGTPRVGAETVDVVGRLGADRALGRRLRARRTSSLCTGPSKSATFDGQAARQLEAGGREHVGDADVHRDAARRRDSHLTLDALGVPVLAAPRPRPDDPVCRSRWRRRPRTSPPG